MTSRRRFISLVPLLGAATLTRAQAPTPLVDPKDPTAVALGYVTDATHAGYTLTVDEPVLIDTRLDETPTHETETDD